tara:strand:+ start:20 stop:994 length:975 start_codon:yes stop_codon:yes gene_type:complete
MAYNTLRGQIQFSDSTTGSIESMVDTWQNQSIGGGKSFTQRLSASAISLGGINLSHPAITTLNNAPSGVPARVLFASSSTTVGCDSTFTFNNSSLTASYFSGSGEGLTAINLAPHKVSGKLSGSNIFYGNGLTTSTEQLVVSGGFGITVGSYGVKANLASNGALAFSSGGEMLVAPQQADAIGSLANADIFVVADNDAGNALKGATGTQLIALMQAGLTFTSPHGSNTYVQYNDNGSFGSNSAFNFSSNRLTVPSASIESLIVSSSSGDGRAYIATPDSGSVALTDARLPAGSISFYLNEGANKLMVRVRYSNGSLKDGEISLT